MALLTPGWMQPASGDSPLPYSAQQDRAGVLAPIFSREGVINHRAGALKVSQRGQGANFSVDIAIGRAAINGDDISDQGVYVATSTTIANLAIPAAPSSGTRTHRVVALIRDKLANAGYSTYDWILAVLPDTGTGLPTEPLSAVTLATVAVSAGAVSVTNPMITDARKPASTGTAALEGSFGALYVGFVASDATRPLRWSVNPDGWVQLAGWVRWNEPNTTVPAGEQRTFGGTPLVDPAVKPPGIRDFAGASVFGCPHYAIFPNGALYFRFPQAITLTTATWFSFDGCFYRLNT